jgi:hypothetical protein
MVQFRTYTATIADLLSRISSDSDDPLIIPDHQREYCWSTLRAQMLIYSIQNGFPIPNVLTRKHRDRSCSLEDGMQRITSLRMYFNDEIAALDGTKFSELDARTRARLENYKFTVTEYNSATDKDAIEIFDLHQNGLPLTVGERLHSIQSLSPSVRYAVNKLLTPGNPLHIRASAIWGSHTKNTGKRYGDLTKVHALVAGAAFGADKISKKWDDISAVRAEPVDEAATDTVFDRLFTIFEEAQARKPIGKAKLKKQFDPGNIAGYILYSLVTYPDDFERLRAGWVDYLVSAREDEGLYSEILHADVSKARSWTTQRWQMGYLRVFDPAEAERIAGSVSADDDSAEEDD